jgi:hypothetical protein
MISTGVPTAIRENNSFAGWGASRMQPWLWKR